jgi:hypothetical protein
MTDHELETLLREHYSSIDPGVAPRGLAARIDVRLQQHTNRWTFLGRVPAFAAGLAAVAAVAVLAVALVPGILTGPASPTATPSAPTSVSPSPSISPTPSPATSPATPSPSPTGGAPSGSVPPVSPQAWSTLDVQPLAGGPTPGSIVAWSGGYLALGGVNPGDAWISTNGRSWTPLPGGTFGSPAAAAAAPAPGGVVVVTAAADGSTTAWRSTDGSSWSSVPAPRLLADDGTIAGTANGVVAVTGASTPRLAYTADGTTWQTVTLPGPATAAVRAVAAFRAGFVAVGDSGARTGSQDPVAWWSDDGRTWQLADVAAHGGDGFTRVAAGGAGLVALSSNGLVPDVQSFWVSPDGRSWALGTDPMGVWPQGEGAGNPNGFFAGDGNRLLGDGIRDSGQPTEYWISTDGLAWTRLALTGDTAAALAGDAAPFLLRDGIVFAGTGGTWIGTPSG